MVTRFFCVHETTDTRGQC